MSSFPVVSSVDSSASNSNSPADFSNDNALIDAFETLIDSAISGTDPGSQSQPQPAEVDDDGNKSRIESEAEPPQRHQLPKTTKKKSKKTKTKKKKAKGKSVPSTEYPLQYDYDYGYGYSNANLANSATPGHVPMPGVSPYHQYPPPAYQQYQYNQYPYSYPNPNPVILNGKCCQCGCSHSGSHSGFEDNFDKSEFLQPPPPQQQHYPPSLSRVPSHAAIPLHVYSAYSGSGYGDYGSYSTIHHANLNQSHISSTAAASTGTTTHHYHHHHHYHHEHGSGYADGNEQEMYSNNDQQQFANGHEEGESMLLLDDGEVDVVFGNDDVMRGRMWRRPATVESDEHHPLYSYGGVFVPDERNDDNSNYPTPPGSHHPIPSSHGKSAVPVVVRPVVLDGEADEAKSESLIENGSENVNERTPTHSIQSIHSASASSSAGVGVSVGAGTTIHVSPATPPANEGTEVDSGSGSEGEGGVAGAIAVPGAKDAMLKSESFRSCPGSPPKFFNDGTPVPFPRTPLSRPTTTLDPPEPAIPSARELFEVANRLRDAAEALAVAAVTPTSGHRQLQQQQQQQSDMDADIDAGVGVRAMEDQGRDEDEGEGSHGKNDKDIIEALWAWYNAGYCLGIQHGENKEDATETGTGEREGEEDVSGGGEETVDPASVHVHIDEDKSKE